jgi:hypothetical protein
MTPPFRVGRKQGRVILDAEGRVVVSFPPGYQVHAQTFCARLNKEGAENWEGVYWELLGNNPVTLSKGQEA